MNVDQILDQTMHVVDKNFAPGEKGREDFHIQLLTSRIRELVMHISVMEKQIAAYQDYINHKDKH